jgi:hypothetical protein
MTGRIMYGSPSAAECQMRAAETRTMTRSARTPPEVADFLQVAERWLRLGRVSKGRELAAGAMAGPPQSDPQTAPKLPPQTQATAAAAFAVFG